MVIIGIIHPSGSSRERTIPEPKIYKATDLASVYTSIKPLCGNRKSAQAYVDRVTRTPWWKDHCPGFFDIDEDPPTRVWVWEGDKDTGGLMDPNQIAIIGDQEMPSIIVGYGTVNACTPAMADKWVLLHELAHVMTNCIEGEGHHGRQFCHSYVKLVDRFLGRFAARNLVTWSKALKIRMDYSLLLS